LLVAFSVFFLASCSDSKTSSENAEAEVSISETQKVKVSFSSESVEVGEKLTLTYSVDDGQDERQRNKPIYATIHWGDITDDRLSINETEISHTYSKAGTYNISIQPDGGEKVRVGTVVVVEPEEITNVPVVSVPADKFEPFTISCNYNDGDTRVVKYFENGVVIETFTLEFRDIGTGFDKLVVTSDLNNNFTHYLIHQRCQITNGIYTPAGQPDRLFITANASIQIHVEPGR